MATKAGKRPLRSLTAHEKLEAIRRVHDGESKASVARDIGVPESTLRGWCKNEDKISYISRQSSPETDDSVHVTSPYEHKDKRLKMSAMEADSPYNLSLKADDNKPLNLKAESPKMSERERNRAELARLSIELGLNRPEMYSSTGNALVDLTSNIGLLSQWNNLLMQTQQQKGAPPAADNKITSTNNLLNAAFNNNNNANKDKSGTLDLSSKVEPPKSVEESVWYWLKTQQAMLGLAAQQNSQSLNMPSSTTSTGGGALPPSNVPTDQNSSWFWKWYKQYTQAQLQLQQQKQQQRHQQPQQVVPQQLPTPPQQQQQQQQQQQAPQILYQQLTKDSSKEADSENLNKSESGEKPQANTNKARAVLDNLLLNNNNVPANCNGAKDSEDLSQSEALVHGEKFLKWLECCSEPSVSAMQIMQFRGLINNIRSGVDRKNGDALQKAKVRRK